MFCIGPAIDLAYAQQRPLMKDFIGVNTRSTDNITYIDKFQSIREYHEWSLDAGFDEDGIANCPQNWLSFNPSYNAAAVVNFDNFYQQLAGRISPSMKWLAPEMRGLTVYNQLVQEQKPLCVDNLPGVGAQGYLPNEEAAAFFNVNTVSRDVAREDLNTSSVFYKNYVHFNAASTFELEAKVDFTSNSWAQAINVWIDQNGNGDFTDPGEALPPVTGIPGTANTVTANFTLPSFTPVNDYFRLRIAVVSNGSAGPCAGGSEVFTYDVAFIASNTGNLTLNTYCSPSPETNFEKSAISEMTIKKDGATVYHKKLKPGPSYNFYNDGSINRLVRGITYWFGLDDVLQVATQAEISVDADINGSFAGAETISYPSAYELAIPATGPTGISVMRITHRNSSGQDVGVWEYPVAIADVNGNVGTNQSGLFASSVFSQTITPNASQAVHQVSLPVDQESAVAYWDYAKWVSIVTARYGYNDVCSDPNNPYCQLLFNSVVDGDVLGAGISGLGNLKYIEFGNEPDKWWYDSEFRNTPNAAWQMMPEQYAALLHAAYDGGGGDPAFALPPTNTSYLGAKNVDGGIKVALAGISDFRGKYLLDLMDKAVELRSGMSKILPFDVLNIHHYMGNNPNIGAAYIENPMDKLWTTLDYEGVPYNGPGLSPEKCKIKERYNKFFNRLLSEANGAISGELAGMENWLSEFGWDTNGSSPIRAELEQGSQSFFTTQAQWLTRAYLELSAVEHNDMVIHKAHMFDMRDGGPFSGQGGSSNYSGGGGLFTHSGLLTNDFKPKRSWYFVQTLKNVLGDTRFQDDLNPEEDPPGSGSFPIQFDNGGIAPRIYYYKGSQRILAIWSPTAAKVNDRELTLDAGDISTMIGEPTYTFSNYTVVQIKDPSEVGFRKGFDVVNDEVVFDAGTVLISETPIFVILGEKIDDPVINCPISGTPEVTAYCNAALLKWDFTGNTAGHWKVYLAKRDEIDSEPYMACPAYSGMDLLGNSYISTYTDRLTADRERILLDGLAPTTDYVAFLVYVDENGIAAQAPCVICFQTNNNAPCIINPCLKVEASDVCFNANLDDFCKLVPDNATAPNAACPGYPCISGDPTQAISCSDYALADGDFSNGTAYQANEIWSFCNNVEVTVTFENYVYLDAIKFYYLTGIDPVEIYYSDCECPDVKKYLTTFQPVLGDSWITITENLPALPVKKLYFYKVPAVYGIPDVKIGMLHFCGEEVTDCDVPQIVGVPNPTQGDFESVWVSDTTDREARLLWKPVLAVRQDKSFGTFQDYEVFIEERVQGQTTMFDPSRPRRTFHYPGLDLVSIPLSGLTPATDYDVLIMVPLASPCSQLPPSDNYLQSLDHGFTEAPVADTLITFTTLEEGLSPRAIRPQVGKTTVPGFHLFPNPAKNLLTATWEGTDYAHLSFYNINGQLAKVFDLPPNANAFDCHIGDLPGGVYVVRLRGEGKVPLQQLAILSGN